MAVITQPVNAFRPYGASDAGIMKMPMPMVLPITSAVHIQKPSSRGSAVGEGCFIAVQLGC